MCSLQTLISYTYILIINRLCYCLQSSSSWGSSSCEKTRFPQHRILLQRRTDREISRIPKRSSSNEWIDSSKPRLPKEDIHQAVRDANRVHSVWRSIQFLGENRCE